MIATGLLVLLMAGLLHSRTVTFQTKNEKTIVDFDSGEYSLEASAKELLVG